MHAVGGYAFETTTQRTYEDALARVTELLAAAGFGIVTEIDMRATLEKKLGVQTRPYKILGACNPAFAHRALAANAHVGVFLPCNVVVWDEGDRRVVAAMEPKIMAQVMDHPELQTVADEVSAMLHAALAKLD